MRLLSLFLRASRGTVAAALLCGLVSGAAGAGLLLLITATLSQGRPWTSLLVLNFAGLGLLALLGRVASLLLLNRLHQQALFTLRTELGSRILATPLRTLEETGAHRLLAALADDVLVISEGLRTVPFTLINIAILLGGLSYLAWLSWSVFLGLLGFLLLGLLTYFIPMGRAARLLGLARDTQDALFKHFRSISEGIKELQLHRDRRIAFLRQAFQPTARELRDLDTRSNNIYSASSSWGMFLFFAFIGLLLLLLPAFLRLPAEALMGYVLTILYLQQPLSAMVDGLPALSRGTVALEKIQSLRLASPELLPEQPPAPTRPALRFERLELRGVTHTYRREQDDSPFTLGPIDLELRPGELVFLVGGNGSGKTTLAKLLTGLYTPESGEIRLNGQPMGEQQLEHYRQHFSTVFSDFHLFDTLLGLPPPQQPTLLQEYLRKLHLDHKVRIQDGVLSTTELSSGQRKRLALLTTWLEDRPVYVFDEWAADQDPTFKEVFYLELLAELKRAGKAVLAITHDDRYFHVADRVLRLESGRLVEPPAASPAPRGTRAANTK